MIDLDELLFIRKGNLNLEFNRGNPNHDELGRFSSGNGISISESKLNDILLEFPDDYKNQESLMMESIAKETGFDKKPIKVSEKEFESNSNDIIYRGINDFKEGDVFIPETTLIEQFYSGKYYAGNGKYGPGIYMHKERNYSEGYSGTGILVECKLSSDAKIMNIKQSIPTSKEYTFEKDFQNYRTIKSQEYLNKSEKAYLSKNGKLGEKYEILAKEYGSMEISTFAAIKGYDAIRDPLGEYTVLNRGKLIYK